MTSTENDFDSETAVNPDNGDLSFRRTLVKTSSKESDRGTDSGSSFTFALQVSVVDGEMLWDAAAAMLRVVAPLLSADEINETLGDRSVPALADCLTTLLLPPVFPGAIIQQVDCFPA